MDPITLPSGAQMVLGIASFEEANALKKAVCRELVQLKVDLSGIDLDDVNGADIGAFTGVVFQVLGSEAIDGALWKCMQRSIYNNQPMTLATFQPEAARQDYQQAAGEVLIFNLLPFGAGLLSLLKANAHRLKAAPGSD